MRRKFNEGTRWSPFLLLFGCVKKYMEACALILVEPVSKAWPKFET